MGKQYAGGLDRDLYSLSKPAEFGACDAFLSHSWHDDSQRKYAALKNWSIDFMKKHNRSPTFWIDKACIDQSSIERDLACLPVFLGACNSLLILSGTTYTSRLWCMLELYVFFSMRSRGRKVGAQIDVRIVSSADLERGRTFDLWEAFDARNCQCVSNGDRERILLAISQGHGGIQGFN